jgi:hypothetical protein
MLYYCNDCLICTPNLSDYNKHIKTMKHYKKVISKNTAVNALAPATASNSIKNNIVQHNQYENDNNTHQETNIKSKQCKYCGVCYTYSSGLSRHMKSCISKITHSSNNQIQTQSQTQPPSDANVMNMMNTIIEDNCAMKRMFVDVIKSHQDLMATQQATTDKVLELYKHNTTSASVTNNNIYNHNGDNHFSITVFLNEKCKDAMNMSDFVNSIELSSEDMENVGRHGYVKGISRIFIDNLKNTDVHKRPIHCSDRKREVLYVKEHDKWEREDINCDKMKDAVRTVEHKNVVILNEWAKQHPECENSDTRANDTYMKFSKNVLDGEDDNILKVVKNIAKETVIERNNL